MRGDDDSTSDRTKDLVEDDIVRSDPSNESEITQCSEDISWNPIPHKHRPKGIHEPSVSRDGPPRDVRVYITEESMKERRIDECRWPYHCSRPYKESSHNTGKSVSDALSRDNQ